MPRHSEYLSTARRLIKEYEARTLSFATPTHIKIALLGAKTNWSYSQREKIIAELEGRDIFNEPPSFSEILKK